MLLDRGLRQLRSLVRDTRTVFALRTAPPVGRKIRHAKAASDGFALVEGGETVEFVAATAACEEQPSTCRRRRFTSCSRPRFASGPSVRYLHKQLECVRREFVPGTLASHQGLVRKKCN